jgi:hypothetical protein
MLSGTGVCSRCAASFKISRPITPPATPPMPPPMVLCGLTRGAIFRFPNAMPANSAQVSLPKEIASGSQTSSRPPGIIRSRSRQESISGNTTPAKMAAVTSEKDTALSVP